MLTTSAMVREALATRLRWIEYFRSADPADMYYGVTEDATDEDRALLYRHYSTHLFTFDTFVMSAAFCDMVREAARTIPADTVFEAEWLQSPSGWMWLEDPISVRVNPEFQNEDSAFVTIDAISWGPIESGSRLPHWRGTTIVRPNSFIIIPWGEAILGHQERAGVCSPLGVILVTIGDTLFVNQDLRMDDADFTEVDSDDGSLILDAWFWAASFLMSQRLANWYKERADRASRRDYKRRDISLADEFVKMVTLRRLRPDNISDLSHGAVEWSCQWLVRGHWRKQWYPSEKRNKPVFIESYIKGPEGMPMKRPTPYIFIAKR